MEDKTIKALFINGGPRRNNNTARILAKAAEGAASEGVHTEIIHLYDFRYCGCTSCFACKLKNAATDGICAVNDPLRPVLQKAVEADIVAIGSPVYFSDITGMTRSFIERFIFPNFSYDLDGQGRRVPPRLQKQTAMIYTMNVPEQIFGQCGYDILLGRSAKIMEQNFGSCETLFVCDTYQFDDYSRYAAGMFSEQDKRRHRDEHFPVDLQRSFDLGCRLAAHAKK